jgi:hypothetical protein
MPLILLGSNSYRGELAPLAESGIEYTHLATLSVKPGEPPVRAYVKVYPQSYVGGKPARGLVNELVGYFFAERAELPVPTAAGLIALQHSQLTAPPQWVDPTKPVVAWWTQDVGFPSLRATWNIHALPNGSGAWMLAISAARDFLVKHGATPAVIALDDLVANVDRNLGNLLISGSHLTLIDHGQTLTGPAWVAPELVASASYPNVVRNLLDTAAETLPYKGAIMAEYSSMVSKVTPAMGELKHWLDQLLEPGDAAAAYAFMQGRMNPGSIARRIGVVA